MDLFHIQEEAAGSIFWHPKGWRLYRTAEMYMRRRLDDAGYQEVKTPQLVDRVLWERSGHWDKYREHMFVAHVEDEKRTLALKPMNCPCHVQIFNHGLRSYRELPLRMAEFGSCHRYEPSGALHGIMRVRAFTQDDAHIFCTPEQIAAETARFVDLLASVYRDFGFDSFRVKFADRPDARVGDDATWDRAEAALREACAIAGVEYELNPAKARSTARSWSSCCGTRSGGTGSAARCRWISCCRSGWTPATSPTTAPASARSCCTGRSWAASSASWAS